MQLPSCDMQRASVTKGGVCEGRQADGTIFNQLPRIRCTLLNSDQATLVDVMKKHNEFLNSITCGKIIDLLTYPATYRSAVAESQNVRPANSRANPPASRCYRTRDMQQIDMW
jgi:hypothetical protein